METSCKVVEELNCSVSNILERITPIDTINQILVIDSPLSVHSYLQINGILIGSDSTILELPENTTVGSVPLLSPHQVDDKYVLPVKTNINGFRILNTHYFNFFTTTLTSPFTSIYSFTNGGFINNYGQNDNTTFTSNFPFLAPSDCRLTSLRFSMVVTQVISGGSPSSTITSTTATIYTLSLSGVETNTGISVVLSTPSPINSRNYGETTFQYPVTKGTSIGIKVQYTGTVSTEVGISAFAILGYKY